MNVQSKLFIFIYLICIINTVSATSVIDNTYFEYAKINIIHIENIQNFSQTNGTDNPANTLSLWINSSRINFSSTTDTHISNISYNSTLDIWSWSANSSDANLTVTALVKNISSNYYLYVNNTLIKSNLSDVYNVRTAYDLNSTGCNTQECITQLQGWTDESSAPASITNLSNTTSSGSINWTWTNPIDIDFNHTMIYIAGTFIENVSSNYYLYPTASLTEYTLSTHTVDSSGNVNTTWVNQTTMSGLITPSNSILNPGFENVTGTQPDNWIWYTNGAGTFVNSSPGFSGNNNAKITITTAGTNVQLYQSGLSLSSTKNYRITFKANSSTGHDLKLILINHTSPYTELTVWPYPIFDLTTSMQTFTFDFRPAINSSNARLQFWFADYDVAGDKYYIDDVTLNEVFTPEVPTISYRSVLSNYYNIVWTEGIGVNATDAFNYLFTINGTGSWVNISSKNYAYVTGIGLPDTDYNITVCGYNASGAVGGCLQNNTRSPSAIVSYEYVSRQPINVRIEYLNITHKRLRWD